MKGFKLFIYIFATHLIFGIILNVLSCTYLQTILAQALFGIINGMFMGRVLYEKL